MDGWRVLAYKDTVGVRLVSRNGRELTRRFPELAAAVAGLDPQLGRFWAHRGEDGVKREKQLLIDFLCASAGGPMYYRGRDMTLCHRGMRISESDWSVFLSHAAATLAKFQVPEPEQREVAAFVQSLKKEIVE